MSYLPLPSNIEMKRVSLYVDHLSPMTGERDIGLADEVVVSDTGLNLSHGNSGLQTCDRYQLYRLKILCISNVG